MDIHDSNHATVKPRVSLHKDDIVKIYNVDREIRVYVNDVLVGMNMMEQQVRPVKLVFGIENTNSSLNFTELIYSKFSEVDELPTGV